MAFGQSTWVLVICLVIAVVFVTVKGNPEPSTTANCDCQPGTSGLADQTIQDNIRSVKNNVGRILHQYKNEINMSNRTYQRNLATRQEVLRLAEATSLAANRSNCFLSIVQIINSIRSSLSMKMLQSLDEQLNRTGRMSCDSCNRLTQIDCVYSSGVNGGVQLAVIAKLRDIYLVTCEMGRRVNSSAPACDKSDLF